jgi:hypothetical protein
MFLSIDVIEESREEITDLKDYAQEETPNTCLCPNAYPPSKHKSFILHTTMRLMCICMVLFFYSWFCAYVIQNPGERLSAVSTSARPDIA